jgi:hypothetical protein
MKSPDVITTGFRDGALFEPQTQAAACWLSWRCQTELENSYDQIRIESGDEASIIRDLKAAGFEVLQQKS